jgi:leucyl aminopeptidase
VSTTAHEIGLEGLDALGGVDALLLFVGEDERPLQGSAGYVDWRLCGQLSRLLEAGFFTGAAGDSLLLPSDGRLPPARIFAVGLGRRETLDAARLTAVLKEAARVLTKAGAQSVALEVPGAERVDDAARAAALQQAFLPAFTGKRVALLADKAFVRLLPADTHS